MKKINQLNRGFTPTPFKRKGVSLQSKRGFTLVETLVAISIFTVSIVALMSVLATGISNANYAKAKITAAYLAQEGIEYVRNLRDTYVVYTGVPGNSWNGFKAKLISCNGPDLGSSCGFDTVFPYNFFVCTNPNDCKLYVDNNGNYSTNALGADSHFVRKIWMTPIGADNTEVKIFSDVSWKQGSGDYNITFSENLFNWVE